MSDEINTAPRCQSCNTTLTQSLVDLGLSPLANSFVSAERQNQPDPLYPLHARVCNSCWLVQVESVVPAEEVFSDYAYFSSYSDSWIAHVSAYADMAIERFHLNKDSQVIEIASNDGYLLKFFVDRGIPSLGIEPAANVAEVARKKGISTISSFFGSALAQELVNKGHRPDLIAAKNVLAHVPDINDFVEGISILLEGNAVFTVEFPHLLNLIKFVQFDTIYHEHYCYLSLLAVEKIMDQHGLRVFDVEEVSTHGGSLRVFACCRDAVIKTGPNVELVRKKERDAKFDQSQAYVGFEQRVRSVRDELMSFLHRAKSEEKTVAAYGAPAKGNTLLNYCGVDCELVAYSVDRNPIKQGKLLPGSHIPILPVETLWSDPADYILILPWNLKDEITQQLESLRSKGCKFVTAIPELAFC